MNVTKTYSLPLEVVELIASLANEYGSQRKVIELAVTQLAGEPLPIAPMHGTKPTQLAPAATGLPKSFAEQKRERLEAEARAAGVCPDCGDKAGYCSC